MKNLKENCFYQMFLGQSEWILLLLQVNTYIETLDVSDNDLQENGGSAFASMLYENFYISDLVRISRPGNLFFANSCRL